MFSIMRLIYNLKDELVYSMLLYRIVKRPIVCRVSMIFPSCFHILCKSNVDFVVDFVSNLVYTVDHFAPMPNLL